jgi:hypothetical protein
MRRQIVPEVRSQQVIGGYLILHWKLSMIVVVPDATRLDRTTIHETEGPPQDVRYFSSEVELEVLVPAQESRARKTDVAEALASRDRLRRRDWTPRSVRIWFQNGPIGMFLRSTANSTCHSDRASWFPRRRTRRAASESGAAKPHDDFGFLAPRVSNPKPMDAGQPPTAKGSKVADTTGFGYARMTPKGQSDVRHLPSRGHIRSEDGGTTKSLPAVWMILSAASVDIQTPEHGSLAGGR